MEWIKCSDNLPPKNIKFLFSYFYGVGIGCWGQCFTIINGNSERTHESYILILNPELMVGDQDQPIEWNEATMIDWDVYWMPLPKSPEE